MLFKSVMSALGFALCVSLTAVRPTSAAPIKAAVVRSQGTIFLGKTIWNDLNSGWSNFGSVPVDIDYTSLGGNGWGLSTIQTLNPDVLIISTAGFLTYTGAEVNAVVNYVQSGHGIIITYDSFKDNKRAWAPLVGLQDNTVLGTAAVTDPLQFQILDSHHPVFSRLTEPYVSGVPYRARPSFGAPWPILDGTVLANNFTAQIPPSPGIIAEDNGIYGGRGLYFSHYIEDKSAGTNQQDMQVFYNGLLWTAGVPEPASAMLILAGAGIMAVRKELERCCSSL